MNFTRRKIGAIALIVAGIGAFIVPFLLHNTSSSPASSNNNNGGGHTTTPTTTTTRSGSGGHSGSDSGGGTGSTSCTGTEANDNDDPETRGIIMIVEIGGTAEEEAAAWARTNCRKPIAAFIASGRRD